MYQADASFPEQPEGAVVRDANGEAWRVTEWALVLERDSKTRLSRVSAQRAFWFRRYVQFPDTILIK